MLKKLAGIFLILIALISFAQQSKISDPKNNHLKSIVVSGKTTTKFIYNESEKLSEVESIHGYHKFYFSKNGLLIREDYAMNPSFTSSASHLDQKQELMTAQNSLITSINFFEYEQDRLKKIKHYSKKNTAVEFVSMTVFIYKKGQVAQCNLTDTNGVLTQFNTYNYDKNGNLLSEKYYSASLPYLTSVLISETYYTFDDKANPNLIYKGLGMPGYSTNRNNVIERNYVLHDSFTKKTTSSINKSLFTYNIYGFPILEKNGNSTFEFLY